MEQKRKHTMKEQLLAHQIFATMRETQEHEEKEERIRKLIAARRSLSETPTDLPNDVVDGEGGKEKDQSSDSKSNEARKNDEDGKDNN